ncbi:MAG: hypothetical protein L6Q81_05085 [Bacteroidia bacterium]|nr:hypothetical protein [Bacteroidia bacterium]
MNKRLLIYVSAALLLAVAITVLLINPQKYFKNTYPEVDNQLHTVLRDQIAVMKRDSAIVTSDIQKLKALNTRRKECSALIASITFDDKVIETLFREGNGTLSSYEQYVAENNIKNKFYSPFQHALDRYGFLEVTGWFKLYEPQTKTGMEQFEKNIDELNDKLSGILGENDFDYELSPDDYKDNVQKSAVINEMKEKFSSTNFDKKKEELMAALADSSAVLSDIRNQSQIVIDKHNSINQLKGSYRELASTSKDSALLQVALPIFGLIIISLLLVPLLFSSREKTVEGKVQEDSVIRNIFANKLILEIFTVFILTITILILGIGDKLSPEVLGTLLGGISIYVLQKSLGQSNTQHNAPSNQSGQHTTPVPSPTQPITPENAQNVSQQENVSVVQKLSNTQENDNSFNS